MVARRRHRIIESIVVAKLRRRKWSQRRIAALLGISKSTVDRLCHVGPLADVPPPARIGRCPTCGVQCLLPCRACYVRRFSAAARPVSDAGRGQGVVQ